MNGAYDAVLFISYGGPEGPEEVEPFLDEVLKGTPIPVSRRREVASHYERFGGVSPLNAHVRTIVADLTTELERRSASCAVYWGNRYGRPRLAETVRRMAEDGVRSALAVTTSPFGGYIGYGRYVEAIDAARSAVGTRAPTVDMMRRYYNHPRLIRAVGDAMLAEGGLDTFDRVIFSAHSVPLDTGDVETYTAELAETVRLVTNEVGLNEYTLGYQSRSGSPQRPWLGPSTESCLRSAVEASATRILVVPVGFVVDNMEISYDLDIELRGVAASLGVDMARSQPAGRHALFPALFADLLEEHAASR
ncbi:MAG: ferrochelatase [Spirochaetales bacterium]|nr:ferrochelatase [Spirochaetales bacterium]